MNTYRIWVLVLLVGTSAVIQAEQDAMSEVMNHAYNARVDAPPRGVDGGPVKVKLQLDLCDIVEVDGSHNQVEIIVWLSMKWSNPTVKWSDDYNISQIYMDPEMLWMPDITIYNLVSPVQQLSPKLVVLTSEGDYLYMPAQRFRFMCDVSGLSSRSGVNCTIKMGSWVYNGNLVSLEEPAPESFATWQYFGGSKYEVLATDAKRNVLTYTCCPETYEDMTFSFVFKKKGGVLSSLWG